MKMKSIIKKTVSGLMAFALTVCALSSVYTTAVTNPTKVRREYGDKFVEGILYRYPEFYVRAVTQNNFNVTCDVTLSIEYYLKENPIIKKNKSDGNGHQGGVVLEFDIPRHYYCNKAESHHRCYYFDFDEILSNSGE